ncbi:hypothetical protein VST7929_00931 [Vibrio stylophorae]|uniref:Uncharacterized protein n=1 Tax=Vibrio stylophorae TaxID=659351 RepID=A0ABM8ZRZ8_9VIBR|nr:hypothetical protein [Vibrio stylophorae]CAH0533078.1 hypothetical protein VST7929_00931 [Vibrio stylophorae]
MKNILLFIMALSSSASSYAGWIIDPIDKQQTLVRFRHDAQPQTLTQALNLFPAHQQLAHVGFGRLAKFQDPNLQTQLHHYFSQHHALQYNAVKKKRNSATALALRAYLKPAIRHSAAFQSVRQELHNQGYAITDFHIEKYMLIPQKGGAYPFTFDGVVWLEVSKNQPTPVS